MGGTPMPTVVEKGLAFSSFDDYYEDSARRLRILLSLKRYVPQAGTKATDQGGVAATTAFDTRILDSQDMLKHMKKHWLGIDGSGNTWFSRLEVQADGTYAVVPVKAAEGEAAVESIGQGMIHALEISLGLEEADYDVNTRAYRPVKLGILRRTGPPPTTTYVMTGVPRRDIPVEIFWVCGKSDGFEMQFYHNKRQVTVFIVTPPLSAALHDPKAYSDPAGRLSQAKTADERAMILFRGGSPSVLCIDDGGVSENP